MYYSGCTPRANAGFAGPDVRTPGRFSRLFASPAAQVRECRCRWSSHRSPARTDRREPASRWPSNSRPCLHCPAPALRGAAGGAVTPAADGVGAAGGAGTLRGGGTTGGGSERGGEDRAGPGPVAVPGACCARPADDVTARTAMIEKADIRMETSFLAIRLHSVLKGPKDVDGRRAARTRIPLIRQAGRGRSHPPQRSQPPDNARRRPRAWPRDLRGYVLPRAARSRWRLPPAPQRRRLHCPQ